jgi:hypothetical protein
MKRLRILLYIVRNKYIVTTLAFLVWIIVFDKNNILSQLKLTSKLHQLKNEKKYFLQQIRQDDIETKELMTDPASLEKFAREEYLMKRDSEDIFLIIHKDTVPVTEN